jgi:sialidase-1
LLAGRRRWIQAEGCTGCVWRRKGWLTMPAPTLVKRAGFSKTTTMRLKDFYQIVAALLCVLGPAAAGAVENQILLHSKCERLPSDLLGPFVKLGDGSVLAADTNQMFLSRDDGRTWQSRPLFRERDKFLCSNERALLRTREASVILAFMNMKELAFKWDQAKGGPEAGCRLPVYITRSLDDGDTWETPQLIQDGYCGAVRNMIQLRTGRVVLVSQKAVRDPGRHVTIVYVSDDQGKKWQASNTIDLGAYGGYGDHGGGVEGTVVELRDGRLWMLLRTERGVFTEAFSDDAGLTWKEVRPSKIEASGAPGKMARLASGRLVLFWNRYIDKVKKTGRREQLSMSLSDDDGRTWTTAAVIGYDPMKPGDRESLHRLAYPYVYEHTPGLLWVTTMQGKLRVRLREGDFWP